MSDFPKVQPGGSLMLAWQVRNKRVLMIGGGEVAAGRILNLLNADALITVVCPASGLNAEVKHRIDTLPSSIKHIDRNFVPEDLDDPQISLVLTAVDDPEVSTQIYKLCHARRIPANIADVPPECDFYFGSVHRDGPLQVMVSTNGNGPRLAALVRRQIAAGVPLPRNAGDAIRKVGELRRRLRRVAPASDEGPKRMRWMSRVCDEWTLEELCAMEEEDMERLLQSYGPDAVPSFMRVRLGDQSELPVFVGSFGSPYGL